jgi:signal transduction histidine kinase
VQVHERLPEPAEVSAYYVITEALTNAAEHARASRVTIVPLAGPSSAGVRLFLWSQRGRML